MIDNLKPNISNRVDCRSNKLVKLRMYNYDNNLG